MRAFNIAIAGLGTVGAGVVRLLRENAGLMEARAGRPIVIKAVSARDKNKARSCDLHSVEWADDPLALPQISGVDAVVELIGGSDGVAYEIAKAAFKNGKHLVTANKALLACHGAELARQAESRKLQLSYEAAVAGGIPIIKTLRESLAGNRILSVQGILNGTCNYILTRMQEAHLGFDAALREAQQCGFAEADPSADIDGHDTAHKISILAALAFGIMPGADFMQIEGIRHITAGDLRFAEQLGYRIKLLGVARMTENGLEQRVGPSLVPKVLSLAHADGALNAVMMRNKYGGDVVLQGEGAGAEPAASSVLADVIDLARGLSLPVFGIPAAQLKKSLAPESDAAKSRFYMRLQAMDKPGVVADISAVLRDERISIESLLQHGRSQADVPVVIVTHATWAAAIRAAADKIARLPAIVEQPCLLRIED